MSVFNIHEFRQRKKRERLALEAGDKKTAENGPRSYTYGAMSNSHLKTAHEWGRQQALEQMGYKSIEEVHKEAAALGLVEQPKVASAPENKLAELFRNLAK